MLLFLFLLFFNCKCLNLCVFSPGVVAFGAFEEASFWFVCASGLLCPVIGDVIITFITGDFDFWIGFNAFEYFYFFCGFDGFFYFGRCF